MSIKSVKIEMIKADGNVVDAEKQGKVEYQPIATITYNEGKKLQNMFFLITNWSIKIISNVGMWVLLFL